MRQYLQNHQPKVSQLNDRNASVTKQTMLQSNFCNPEIEEESAIAISSSGQLSRNWIMHFVHYYDCQWFPIAMNCRLYLNKESHFQVYHPFINI